MIYPRSFTNNVELIHTIWVPSADVHLVDLPERVLVQVNVERIDVFLELLQICGTDYDRGHVPAALGPRQGELRRLQTLPLGDGAVLGRCGLQCTTSR